MAKAPKAPKAPKAGEAADERKDPRLQSQEAPKKEEPPSEEGPPVYVNVLAVRESDYKGKAGDEYAGLGIQDSDEGRARLAHLLKRGAVRRK